MLLKTLPTKLRAEALSSKRLPENQLDEITWNWDTDSNSKVNSPLRVVFNAY